MTELTEGTPNFGQKHRYYLANDLNEFSHATRQDIEKLIKEYEEHIEWMKAALKDIEENGETFKNQESSPHDC